MESSYLNTHMPRVYILHFVSLFITLFIFFFSVPTLYATDRSLASQGYYTLNFLANEEVVVYARLVISNNEAKPLNEITIELPSGDIRDMAIFQQALPQKCLNYITYPGGFSCSDHTDAEFKDFIDYPRGILWTQLPYYTASYLKAPYKQVKTTYNVTFPLPVKQFKATGLVISYVAKGYAHETFPGYIKYSFTTFKVPAVFHTEQIAVDVDNDVGLYIYDQRTQRIMNRSVITGYANQYYPAGGKVSISSLDSLITSAGLHGAKTYKSQVLLADKTYTITGDYGKNETVLHYSPLLRHSNSIAIGVAAIFAFFIIQLRIRKHHRYSNG